MISWFFVATYYIYSTVQYQIHPSPSIIVAIVYLTFYFKLLSILTFILSALEIQDITKNELLWNHIVKCFSERNSNYGRSRSPQVIILENSSGGSRILGSGGPHWFQRLVAEVSAFHDQIKYITVCNFWNMYLLYWFHSLFLIFSTVIYSAHESNSSFCHFWGSLRKRFCTCKGFY